MPVPLRDVFNQNYDDYTPEGQDELKKATTDIYGGNKSIVGGGSNSGGGSSSSIDKAAKAKQDAAEKAAEAERDAAKRSYKAKEKIAKDAKVSAKGQYDWLIETLGSNKQDLLDQVTLNTDQGLRDYDTQGKQTTEKYDQAKQEILSTYRDLQTQQEKIMRGAGMGQSSRSMEAQLRLNNLMGKDLGSVSKNEADALALIGNAVTTLKENALATRTSIERETKSKLDKAALDYNDQITAIDNNLNLSKNEKISAYERAEVQLARDTAAITSWAEGLKLQAEETLSSTKQSLDDLILNMTDEKGLLNSGLSEKEAATNQFLEDAGYTPLSQNSEDSNNIVGQYQKTSKKYNSLEEIQNALASGQISSTQAEQAMAALTSGTNAGAGSRNIATANPENPITNKDPLLSAIYA